VVSDKPLHSPSYSWDTVIPTRMYLRHII